MPQGCAIKNPVSSGCGALFFGPHSSQSYGTMRCRSAPAVGLGLLLAGAPALETSGAGQPSISLVEARLSKVEDISGEPGAPCICDEEGHTLLDGAYRLTFAPLRTLAGMPVHASLSMKQASAKPIPGLEYFLIINHRSSGDAIEWKDLARDGLCLDPRDADRYGLTQELRNYPCRQP